MIEFVNGVSIINWEHDKDLVSKRCEHESFKTLASFGNPIKDICDRCYQHKLTSDVDVTCKKCEYEGCLIQASFGNPIDPIRKRCLKHTMKQ